MTALTENNFAKTLAEKFDIYYLPRQVLVLIYDTNITVTHE